VQSSIRAHPVFLLRYFETSAFDFRLAQPLYRSFRTHRREIHLFKRVLLRFRAEHGQDLDVPVVVVIDRLPVAEAF